MDNAKSIEERLAALERTVREIRDSSSGPPGEDQADLVSLENRILALEQAVTQLRHQFGSPTTGADLAKGTAERFSGIDPEMIQEMTRAGRELNSKPWPPEDQGS